MKAVGVVVVAILGIAVIVAAVSLFVRVPGGLGSYEHELAAKMPVGGVYSFGMGTVTTDKFSVEVEEVRLHDPPEGVELAGALLYYNSGCYGGGVVKHYPPCASRSRVGARNAVVPADRRYLLWIGLRVLRARAAIACPVSTSSTGCAGTAWTCAAKRTSATRSTSALRVPVARCLLFRAARNAAPA